MSSPFDAEREGTILDEGLADKTLDPFRQRPTVQNDPYIIGPGSMPQQPDPNPWQGG
jgi:hypothetical protein